MVTWTAAPVAGNEIILVLPAGAVFPWDPALADLTAVKPKISSKASTFKVLGPTRFRLSATGVCGVVLEMEPSDEKKSKITVQIDGRDAGEHTTPVIYTMGETDRSMRASRPIVCPAIPVSIPLLGVSEIEIGQQVYAPNIPDPNKEPLWYGSIIEGKVSAYKRALFSKNDVAVVERPMSPGDLLVISKDTSKIGAAFKSHFTTIGKPAVPQPATQSDRVEAPDPVIWGVIEHRAVDGEHAFRVIAHATSPDVAISHAGRTDDFAFALANYQTWQAQPLLLLGWFIITACGTLSGAAITVYKFLQGRSDRQTPELDAVGVVALQPLPGTQSAAQPTNQSGSTQ